MSMRLVAAKAAGAALGAAPAAEARRTTEPPALEVLATVQPLGDGHGRGVAHLSGRPGEGVRARGILTGVPASQESQLAVAPRPCAEWITQRPAGDINDISVFASPPATPDGVVLVDTRAAGGFEPRRAGGRDGRRSRAGRLRAVRDRQADRVTAPP